MKRSWFGFFLLAGLLVLSLLSSRAMVRIYQADARQLSQASEEALQGNWREAAALTARVRRNWDKWELFRCAMADHNPAEEIDILFSVLEVYGATREELAFASVARETAQKLEAIGEAHRLDFCNLL